jgi:CRISPR/Cas system-associated exonuclease Cas4 (RecB family)
LIKQDIAFIEKLKEQNHFLSLKHLEQEFAAPLEIDVHNKKTTIYIKGKMDRVDGFQDFIRIIDYKSSVKTTDKFEFDGFEKLFHDTNYNKQFQLFLYAWLLYKNNFCAAEKMLPGIIPFKNFSEQPLYVLKNKSRLVFTDAFLQEFEVELIQFVESIFNTTLPFEQTSDKKLCEYCAYNRICNIAE